jgi:hypothetical protein
VETTPYYLITDFGQTQALASPIYSQRKFAEAHLRFCRQRYPDMLPTRVAEGKEWLRETWEKDRGNRGIEWPGAFSGDDMLMDLLKDWVLNGSRSADLAVVRL